MKEQKKYKYSYPSNKELGRKLLGASRFVWETLNRKYSLEYVRDVMGGRRNNAEIVNLMKHLVELSKAENY